MYLRDIIISIVCNMNKDGTAQSQLDMWTATQKESELISRLNSDDADIILGCFVCQALSTGTIRVAISIDQTNVVSEEENRNGVCGRCGAHSGGVRGCSQDHIRPSSSSYRRPNPCLLPMTCSFMFSRRPRNT
jgi:hypothetical protein